MGIFKTIGVPIPRGATGTQGLRIDRPDELDGLDRRSTLSAVISNRIEKGHVGVKVVKGPTPRITEAQDR